MRTSTIFWRENKTIQSSFKALLVALVMFIPSLVQAQGDYGGIVVGRIVAGDSGLPFEGATVEIEELGLKTTSASDGRYRFSNVPTGTYTVVVDYLGVSNPKRSSITVEGPGQIVGDITLPQEWFEMEEILIIGNRAGLMSARNQERNADELKTVVASDAIGQFADQNIAESLQRLPGVNIERDAGEGRFATVRGMRAEFTNVEIDGVKVGGGEAGDTDSGGTSRSVRLDTISSDILESLEVIKTPMPEMEGDAVGATIKLKTLSAFDRGGRSYRFRLEASEQSILKENNLKGTVTYTDIFDVGSGELGLAISATRQDRDIARTQFQVDDDFTPVALDGTGAARIPVGGDEVFVVPDRIEDIYRTNLRERQAVTFNLDWRPNESHEYFLRFTDAETKQKNTRWRNRYDLGDRISDDRVLEDPGEVLALGPFSARLDDADIRKDITISSESETTEVFTVGGVNRLDSWTLDYSLGMSETSDGDDQFSMRPRWRARDIIVGYQGGTTDGRITEVTQVMGEDNPTSAADYDLQAFFAGMASNKDEITTFQFNAEKEFENGNTLKFGIKATNRDRSRVDISENIRSDVEGLGIIGDDMGDLAALGIEMENVSGFAGSPTAMNFMPNPGQLIAVLNGSRSQIEQFARDGEVLTDNFDMSEDVIAYYLQGTYNFTDNLRFVGGLRVEQTDFDSGSGILNEEIDVQDTTPTGLTDTDQEVAVQGGTSSYTDVLPRVMLRWEPNDQLIVRFALTSAVQRPDFDDVAPGADVETEENEVSGMSDVGDGTFDRVIKEPGNPNLEPARSNQFDAYLTWYPSEDSSLQVGYFLKKIDDFFVKANLNGSDVALAGYTFNQGNTIDGGYNEAEEVALNGEEAEISGLELSYSRNFSNGFFFAGSWTTVDSEADYGILRPGEELPLVGQSDNVGNFSLGWENNDWSVRLSASHQDDMFFRVSSASKPESDMSIKGATYMDLGVRYNINDNFTVYTDIININEEERVRFFHGLVQPWSAQIENFGRTVQIGVTGSF